MWYTNRVAWSFCTGEAGYTVLSVQSVIGFPIDRKLNVKESRQEVKSLVKSYKRDIMTTDFGKIISFFGMICERDTKYKDGRWKNWI